MHTSFTRKLISDKFGALTEMAGRKLKLLEELDCYMPAPGTRVIRVFGRCSKIQSCKEAVNPVS